MLGDGVIDDIASMLDVTIVAPLPGGQFGACQVVDAESNSLVLKAWPLPTFGPDWQRGAALANRLRSTGYPAPHYLGAGATEHACWSLQEFLPGAVPSSLTPVLASQLVSLAHRHADAASSTLDFGSEIRTAMVAAIETLRTSPATAQIADELAVVLERTHGLATRARDVVHYDFHAQNLLCEADTITGVFDWEGARPGDWRSDLANLVVTSDARECSDALQDQPKDIAAFFIGWHCARYLAFDITNHPPERVQAMAPHVEARLAHWWRVVG